MLKIQTQKGCFIVKLYAVCKAKITPYAVHGVKIKQYVALKGGVVGVNLFN